MPWLDSARGRYGLAALAYAAITAAIFRNLLPVVSTHIYGGLGDPLLNASILAWNATHVPLSAAWWNYPAFAPLSGVTAWTEHLLGAYPLATPIVLATGNPVLAYNVLLLVCFPLNGVAMYALAREITRSDAGACVAGLAFAFAPYLSGQVSHVQILMAFGMPVALLGLHRQVEQGRRGGVALFAVGWLIVVLSNAYMLVFFPIFVALWCVWFACPRGPEGSAPHTAHPVPSGADLSGPRIRRLVPIALAGAAVTIAAAPLLWGYHARQSAYGLTRNYDEIRSFGADLRGLAGISDRSLLWRPLLDPTLGEAAIFPGLAILILTAIGVAPRLRTAWRRRDPVVFYLAGAAGMWLLAVGPEPSWAGSRVLARGPFWLLMHLPGVDAIRVAARAWLPAALGLAVTAGAGAAALSRHARGRWVALALALMMVAEGWFTDVAAAIPEPVGAGVIPPGALVLDLPLGRSSDNVPAEYLAVMGGYRTINGFSGYAPPHFAPLREALAAHQDEAFDAFRRLDDVYVIVRPSIDAPFVRWLESQPGDQRLFQTPAWTLYRLPRIGGGAPATLPVPLPAPGRFAFVLRQ